MTLLFIVVVPTSSHTKYVLTSIFPTPFNGPALSILQLQLMGWKKITYHQPSLNIYTNTHTHLYTHNNTCNDPFCLVGRNEYMCRYTMAYSVLYSFSLCVQCTQHYSCRSENKWDANLRRARISPRIFWLESGWEKRWEGRRHRTPESSPHRTLMDWVKSSVKKDITRVAEGGEVVRFGKGKNR